MKEKGILMYDNLFAPATKSHTPRTARTSDDTNPAADKKQSIYFRGTLLETLKAESARVDRSLSWVVCFCIENGLAALQAMSSVSDPE